MDLSPKRAALEAWLATAEEILAEQREHSISPSSVPGGQHGRHTGTAAVFEIERGLSSILRRLVFTPGRWILILEDGRNDNNHFVQFLVYEDGSLVAETVSNHYLAEQDQWTPEAESELVALGWQEPKYPKRPNWLVICPTISPPVAEVAQLGTATLQRVLGLGNQDQVVMTLFSSPLRGDTPACPVYQCERSEPEGGNSPSALIPPTAQRRIYARRCSPHTVQDHSRATRPTRPTLQTSHVLHVAAIRPDGLNPSDDRTMQVQKRSNKGVRVLWHLECLALGLQRHDSTSSSFKPIDQRCPLGLLVLPVIPVDER